MKHEKKLLSYHLSRLSDSLGELDEQTVHPEAIASALSDCSSVIRMMIQLRNALEIQRDLTPDYPFFEFDLLVGRLSDASNVLKKYEREGVFSPQECAEMWREVSAAARLAGNPIFEEEASKRGEDLDEAK